MLDEIPHNSQVDNDLTICLSNPSTTLKLRELERAAVEAALQRVDGNVSKACRLLGIGRTTLYRKLKNYGILAAA